MAEMQSKVARFVLSAPVGKMHNTCNERPENSYVVFIKKRKHCKFFKTEEKCCDVFVCGFFLK